MTSATRCAATGNERSTLRQFLILAAEEVAKYPLHRCAQVGLIVKQDGAGAWRDARAGRLQCRLRLGARRIRLEVGPRQFLERRRERVGKLASGDQNRAEPECEGNLSARLR